MYGQPFKPRSFKRIFIECLAGAIIGIALSLAYPTWAWERMKKEWHDVAGQNKHQLVWRKGKDGKGSLQPYNAQQEYQDVQDDLKRQMEDRRRLENKRAADPYYVPFFEP